MRSLVFSLALLYGTLVITTAKNVNVFEYAPDDCNDYTPVVSAILKDNPEGNITLIFPKGEYHFHNTFAYAKYHAVTNHDNGYKYFAFPIIGMENVVVEGNGSDFIFHGVITPFLVEKSRNVTLKGFSIDWDEIFYLQATVVGSSKKDRTADLEFSDFSKFRYEQDKIVLTNNKQDLYFLGESMVFDPKTMAVAYNATKYQLGGASGKSASATRLDEKTYRVKLTKESAPEGMVYVFKGPNGGNRLAPAIHLTGSSDTRLKDIDIYHAGGMGVIGERTEDILLDNVNVRLREGSGRMVTTTADATHFCNCKGLLTIENCLFENMLDDATNIHGTYMRIVDVLDGNTIIAKLNHPQQYGYDFAGKGDEIRIVDAMSMLPKGSAHVVSAEMINEIFIRIVLDAPVDLKPGDAAENVTWYPEVVFRNNIVRNNRARSILLSAGKKILVEKNTFSSMMTSILFEGDLEHWFESGAVSDVVIRNNTFNDCCYGGREASIIWINPHLTSMPEKEYYEGSIRIENNQFRSFDRPVLNAKSVRSLIFKGNTIDPSGTYPRLFPDKPEINVIHTGNFVMTENSYCGDRQAEAVIGSSVEATTAINNGNIKVVR